jgi:hypothetical protein
MIIVGTTNRRVVIMTGESLKIATVSITAVSED